MRKGERPCVVRRRELAGVQVKHCSERERTNERKNSLKKSGLSPVRRVGSNAHASHIEEWVRVVQNKTVLTAILNCLPLAEGGDDESNQKGLKVEIKIPEEAAERLRKLAEANDPRLAALGISGIVMGDSGKIIPIFGADGSSESL